MGGPGGQQSARGARHGNQGTGLGARRGNKPHPNRSKDSDLKRKRKDKSREATTHSSFSAAAMPSAMIELKVIVRSRFDSGSSRSSCAGAVGSRSCV